MAYCDNNMKRARYILLCLVALWSQVATAQFYNTGAGPSNLRWRLYDNGSRSLVAPDYYDHAARRVLHYMEAMTPTIGYGLPVGELLDAPVVMHTENSASNGLSIWAPLRIEMSGMPAVESYAQTWLRQLSVHEFRHTAQYSALNQGLIKSLRPLLGQQWMLLTSGLMPFWWIEGDATDAETQSSSFGRALQPSFTMHYRAVGRDMLRTKNPDIWFGGSYNHHIPSHYELGYQLVTKANTMADRYVWGEVVDYVAHRPYTIFPTEWAMRERLGYSTEELFRATFNDLNDWWDALPAREDSAQRIATDEGRRTPYQTLRWPVWADANTVVALRGDFDRPQRFVAVDVTTGRERKMAHTGLVNSPPTIVDGYIYWTEMRQLSSFAQQVGSVMCRMPVGGGRVEQVLHESIYALYPAEYDGTLAFVRYDFEGTYTIVCIEGEWRVPEGVEVHGLASDGGWLYYLTTSAQGMAIERVCPKSWSAEVVKAASRVSLSDLRAADGRLYFGSIASGYDEVHTIDLTTGREWRLTTSRYGAFDGAPSPDGERVAVTLYDAAGYHLAVAPVAFSEEVPYMALPANVVNPPRYRWQGMGQPEEVTFDKEELQASQQRYPSKPYRRAAHLLDFHSWAPIYYRPEELMAGNLGEVGLGVSATSQNLLSTAFTTVGYRYGLLDGSHTGVLNFKYVGLKPKFEIYTRLGSQDAGVAPPRGVIMKEGDYYRSYDDSDTGVRVPAGADYSLQLTGRISWPWVLHSSYWTRVLTPAVEFSHSNARLYNPDSRTYSSTLSAAALTLQWNSYTRMAQRNLQPRWGVAVAGGVGRMLAGFDSPTTVGVFTRLWLPAFGANDALTVKAAWQGIEGDGPLAYALDFGWTQPRGYLHFVEDYAVWPDDNVGLSLQYATPLCYPDVGISGVVLLKRVRLGVFADAMAWRGLDSMGGERWSGMVTCGGDVWIDTSWFRLPSQGDLSLRVSLYKDALHKGAPVVSAGVNVNF